MSKENIISLMNSISDKKSDNEFECKLIDDCKRIYDSVKSSKVIKDSYGNSLLDIGDDSNSEKFSHYDLSNDTLNWPLWLALYNGSWVFKRAIDKPAQDEIRCGIEILNNNITNKNEIIRKTKLYRDDLIQLLTWGALFGGSVAFAMFDNFTDEDYSKPYNKAKVKAAKTMKFYVVDRWYGLTPNYNSTVTNMSDSDFGKPKFYEVTMADGKTYKYHHDYVIRYEHRFAPKLIKNGMLQGWGYSEGSHIIGELSRDEKLKNSIQSLINKSLIEVIKMSGMRGVFMGADKDNEEQLQKRLQMVNWGRGFNSLTFLDKDDDYTMNSFSGLSGLSDLLQQNMWLISSALEMQGVLFGDLKSGFANDTEALERYDEVINGRCESYVRPVYEKLLKFIYTMMGIEEKPDFNFKSLMVKQQDKERIESLKNFTELCSTLLGDGVITSKQYAKALQTYTTKGTVDFNLTNDVIAKMDEEFDLEKEDFSFETIEKDKNQEELENIKLKGI